ATGWHLVNPQTAASNLQLEDDEDILEFDFDSEDDEDDEDYVVLPEDNKAVNENTEYRQETSRAALAVYLMDLGLASVEAVFEVVYEVPPRLAQYVVVLKEGSHTCTCLQLRNKGVTCAHFFRAMRFDSCVQYHIQLIPTRWFREDKQDDPGLEAEISEFPFTLSMTHGQSTESTVPSPSFLVNYRSIIPRTENIPRLNMKVSVMTQRFVTMQNFIEGTIQELIRDDRTFEHLQRTFQDLAVYARSAAIKEKSKTPEIPCRINLHNRAEVKL
ncbi:hypothetical protein BGX26_003745, partial [Mortierella sp. AD094]